MGLLLTLLRRRRRSGADAVSAFVSCRTGDEAVPQRNQTIELRCCPRKAVAFEQVIDLFDRVAFLSIQFE